MTPWRTEHQRGIVERVSYGQTVKEIAGELGIAPGTVTAYLKAMKQRARVRSLPHLVRILMEDTYGQRQGRERGRIEGAAGA